MGDGAERVFYGKTLPPAHAADSGVQKREINTTVYHTKHVTVRSGTVSSGRGSRRAAEVSMMWTCHFCDGETGLRETLEHDACRKEHDRRKAARVCVRCGVGRAARAMQRTRGICAECRNAEYAPYAGYPGGNV